MSNEQNIKVADNLVSNKVSDEVKPEVKAEVKQYSAEVNLLFSMSKLKSKDFVERLYNLDVDLLTIDNFHDEYSAFTDKVLKTICAVNKDIALTAKSAEINEFVKGSLITDKEFALRLIKLSMPKGYAKEFRDEDRALTDKMLWTRVRNIEQVIE